MLYTCTVHWHTGVRVNGCELLDSCAENTHAVVSSIAVRCMVV